MKPKSLIFSGITVMCILLALAMPVVAGTVSEEMSDAYLKNASPVAPETKDETISLELIAKTKVVNNGDTIKLAAIATDSENRPLLNRTVLFFQNIVVAGINVDTVMGEAVTNENGVAIFKSVVSTDGNYGELFAGAGIQKENSDDIFSSEHVMIRVINEYPVVSEDKSGNKKVLN
ncbi:hypothetical protein F1737_09955 [Methanoplanus sp. FWC-SCC4]|uniref:Uncharacterized protein n=1 Tax=Methanochimaera problematica TaxID=2609417 RepID=A0AA97FF06_9EURY|nr:hypothetical protein [Methanoplanus sp. FWC-SCC4]WOF16984.1 hypothetical protein F1737_09955 [Methanoplanus sp. FWC-SCC4]